VRDGLMERHVRCITRCLAYRAQGGFATEGSAAGAHPRAPHAAARTVALCARAHWHCAPARGYVRLACDGARVLAALGGLDSSGVAGGGTSSEEAEAYHARAKNNLKHVRAGKVRVRLDTRGYITRLAETGVQVVLFRRTAGSERTGRTKS
jgi:hypothetical protein